jgi:hypothetical protein
MMGLPRCIFAWDLFGVELLTPGRIAGKIGEQHGDLSALPDRIDRRSCRRGPRYGSLVSLRLSTAQRGDGVEQLAAVTNEGDAELLEILAGQPGARP